MSDHTKTLLTFYVHFSKNQAVNKWLPFELICAIYLEYIVTSNFVKLYPILQTLYVQHTVAGVTERLDKLLKAFMSDWKNHTSAKL